MFCFCFCFSFSFSFYFFYFFRKKNFINSYKYYNNKLGYVESLAQLLTLYIYIYFEIKDFINSDKCYNKKSGYVESLTMRIRNLFINLKVTKPLNTSQQMQYSSMILEKNSVKDVLELFNGSF